MAVINSVKNIDNNIDNIDKTDSKDNIKNDEFILPALKIFKSKDKVKKDSNGWINIGRLPKHVDISNPVKISNHEFVVATTLNPSSSTRDSPHFSGIWGYNINIKRWKYVCKYKEKVIKNIQNVPCITYNPNKCKLYIYSCVPPIFFSINLLNNKHTIYHRDKRYYDCSLLYLNNCVHFFANIMVNGSLKTQHSIWDFKKSEEKIVDVALDDLQLVRYHVVNFKKRNEMVLLDRNFSFQIPYLIFSNISSGILT